VGVSKNGIATRIRKMMRIMIIEGSLGYPSLRQSHLRAQLLCRVTCEVMGRATTFHLQAGQKPGRDAKEEMDMESWGELFTLKLRIVETWSELQLYIVVIIYKYIIFIIIYI